MKRTTVKIPDALDAQLRHEAERRETTISQITREALEAYLGGDGGRAGRRLMSAGRMRSADGGAARRIEQLLQEEAGRPNPFGSGLR
jgi:predicted transcriptional regulator